MKKFLLWFLALAAILAIGFFVATSYLKSNWKPLLEEQLKKAVLSSTDSLYSISYKSIDVNPLTGNLNVIGFKLTPDSNVYKKMVNFHTAPNNLFKLEVDKLLILNANASKAVAEKKLSIGSILIDHPKLTIINDNHSFNDTAGIVKKDKTLFQLIKNIFKEVHVKEISLRQIDFTHVKKSTNKIKKTAIKNLDISIRDILVDSLSQTDPTRLYYTKNIVIKLLDYKIATPDSLYYAKIDKLEFSSAQNILAIKQFKLQPRLTHNGFYRKVGYSKDYFDLTFNNLTIKDFDFDLFLDQQKLKAETFIISNAKVAVYNNNAYAKHLKDKTGKFPHQQFLKVALDMNIAKVKLSNVDISYSEYDATSKQTGKITFNNTRGTIYNVTNTKEDLAKNSVMVAKLKTNILNLAPLDLTFKFFMNSKIGAFSYNGVLGAFDGKIANQIVRPLGMAEIKSAKIEKLAFQVQANQNIARGKMQFIYKNLKVNVLKRDENGKLKKQGFISKLANLFIINDANPDKRGKFIEGVINYERPKTVSFFSFLWKSLFTGIKQSVGVSSAKESKIKNSTIAIQNVVSDFKTTIAIIKENRKEHKRNRKIKKLAKLKEESKDTTIGRTKQ
jgi:hypothetical protein